VSQKALEVLLPGVGGLLRPIEGADQQVYPGFFASLLMASGLLHIHLLFERGVYESCRNIPMHHLMLFTAVVELEQHTECAGVHNRGIGIGIVYSRLLEAAHNREPSFELLD